MNRIVIGRRYGCWLVLDRTDHEEFYRCRCLCGREYEVQVTELLDDDDEGCVHCAGLCGYVKCGCHN